MNSRDKMILEKISVYCSEINNTHSYFNSDKALFNDKEKGFIYRNSISMPILQIGELSKTLSEDFLSENTTVPWRMIMRMRDIVAHHYGSLDYEIVWNTSKSDIPNLKSEVIKLLSK